MSVAQKLKEINRLKKELISLRPIKDCDQNYIEQLKINFTYYSNKIEGNSLTYGQTLKLLRDLIMPSHAGTGEMLDMINHKKVLDIVFINYRSYSLTEESIRSLHRELMKDRSQWTDDGVFSPGKYKEFDNLTYRQSGQEHKYLPAANVQVAMEQLVKDVNFKLKDCDSEIPEKHPLSVATYFHQKFLNEIHPFSDGNGRIGRIFLNIILLKSGYPPLFIKEVDRRNNGIGKFGRVNTI
jgi:Fic family protein